MVTLSVGQYLDNQFYFQDGWYWAVSGGGSGRAEIMQFTEEQTKINVPGNTETRSIKRGRCETYATGHRICVTGQAGAGRATNATFTIYPPEKSISGIRDLKASLYPAANEKEKVGVRIEFFIEGELGAIGQIMIDWWSGAKGFEKWNINPALYPMGLKLGKNTMENALPLPAGTHQICVTVV